MDARSEHGKHRPNGWGADLSFEKRPGVPKLKTPAKLKGARDPIRPQPTPMKSPTRRVELKHLTPVFGTAQLPEGVSGLLRRFAYKIPEHKARRWLLLIAADQVDVLEHRLATGGVKLLVGGVATGIRLLARGVMKKKQ